MTLRWTLTGLVDHYPTHDEGLEAIFDRCINGFVIGLDFTIENH